MRDLFLAAVPFDGEPIAKSPGVQTPNRRPAETKVDEVGQHFVPGIWSDEEVNTKC